MLRTLKRLIALSFGIALAVDEHRTRFVWPRPCLLRPWFLYLSKGFECEVSVIFFRAASHHLSLFGVFDATTQIKGVCYLT